MLDYTYHDEDGRAMPVRQMPRSAIVDILDAGGVNVIDEGLPCETEQNVLDRLRIELVIRSLLGEQH